MKIGTHTVTKLDLIFTAVIVILGYLLICKHLEPEKFDRTGIEKAEKERDIAKQKLDSIIQVNDSIADVPKTNITPDTVYLQAEKQVKKEIQDLKSADTSDQFQYFKGIFKDN